VARNSAIDKAIITAYESLGLEIAYTEKQLVYLIYDYAAGQGLSMTTRQAKGFPLAIPFFL